MKKFLLINLVCLLVATNMFAQTQGSLSGLFSVSATTKVRFSQGNLQYQASTKKTWRFAEHQYDIIGSSNSNISSSYSGWIDLFGWGTSGWNSGASSYQPYSTSTTNSSYYVGNSSSNNLTGSYANADWGVYNAIQNGGNSAGMWRTLTYIEWDYVLSKRTDANTLKGLATVNGVTGMILLPDNWTTPTEMTFTSGINGFKSNTYTSSQWSKMEANGAVFLPAAGRRLVSSIGAVGYEGYYWTSSADRYDYTAYLLYFDHLTARTRNFSNNRGYGCSVRLVQNSTVSTNYTITTSALPTEGGMVTEGGSFVYGTNKTIEATPNPDYQFVMWDDGSTDNPRAIVVTGNATYTAIFEPTEQTSPNNSNGALSGLFSVSADKTVRFSMGNLQYRASTNTWRFAMNQWHAIGQDNANIASDYDGWIDMFGWGTSGWNSGAVCYQPFSSSKNDSDYYVGGNSKNNLIGDYANADWGVYNKITNGGNQVDLWNTLTTEEWKYLIEERTNANNLRGIGTVNGMNGLILLPDNWDTPEGLEFNTNFGSETNRNLYPTTNSFTLSQWKQMEDRGAIFLPACDLGHEINSNFNVLGHYWSSIGAENLRFSSQDIKYQVNDRYSGMSVRLVQESYSIQVVPSDIEMGQTSGSGIYRKNEEIEITATPNPDYQFVMWDDGSTDNPRSIVITGNATYTATFSYVGHSYGVPTYEWNTDSTQCTATRICSNDASHIETETATSSIDTTAATCINTGLITYTVSFTNTAFTAQTVTKEIPVLGHDYEKESWSWSSDYKTASLKFVCQNDNNHVETINAVVTTDTTKATCLADGKIVYTAKATFEGTEYTDTKEVTLTALGHDYQKDSWSWSSDYKTASLKFVCQNDANHTETINAEVTIDTIEATCLTNGRIVYTATAILDNSEYTETTDATLQIEVRPRLNNNTIGKFSLCGSDYQFLIKSNDPWTELQFEIWKEGVKCSKTDFAASNLNTHSDWVQPDNWYFNASQNNVTGYWLIYNPTENTLQYQTSEPNCMEYTDTKEVTLPATGHTEIIDNSVVPTCTTTGVTEGKHCSVCGATIIAQTTLPALGHTYIKDSWIWASDFSSASVKFICQNNASHVETINAVVTTDTTKETCMSDGKIAYTAIATLDGTEFTDTKETTVQIEVKPRLNIATTGNFSSCGSNYKFMLKSDNQYTESQFEIWKDGVKCIKTDFVSTNLNTHSDWAQPDNWYFNASPNNVTGYWLFYNPTENTLQYQTSEPNCTEYITDTKEIILPALKPTTHTITEISYGEFTLNGQTYNESGVYTQMLTNSQGCDSVLTINLTVKKEEDLELTVLELFTTCEYRDAIQIESYTEGMNFTWSINGEIDKTQTGDTYRIPSSAPLNGIVKVTGTIGTISISKTIQYSIYKEIAKKMWDDVVSIINPKHEFVAFEWYHNDKKISNAEYYNELGGVTGFYYVIATDKENEKIHSCILNFEADSQLKLFPNPTEGEVTFINDGNTEVRIFDTTGKLLATETIIPADGYSTIDLSSYPQGIYYLHIGKNIFKVVRK